MSIKRGFVIAVTLVAVQGCQNGSSDAGTSDVSGRWAMFAFEDPVAVEIIETGGVIDGLGCCGGLNGANDHLQCCGALAGEIVDRRASFGFSFDGLGERYDYSTDVFVSADGKRMAGTFSRQSVPVAWVRIGAGDAGLPAANPALVDALAARQVDHALTLSGDPAPGNDFSPQQTYRLLINSQFVYGDLGSFWAGEMSWNAVEQTFVVGPVLETAPGLPVALRLHFDGPALTSAEADMASGARYHFRATPSQP